MENPRFIGPRLWPSGAWPASENPYLTPMSFTKSEIWHQHISARHDAAIPGQVPLQSWYIHMYHTGGTVRHTKPGESISTAASHVVFGAAPYSQARKQTWNLTARRLKCRSPASCQKPLALAAVKIHVKSLALMQSTWNNKQHNPAEVRASICIFVKFWEAFLLRFLTFNQHLGGAQLFEFVMQYMF